MNRGEKKRMRTRSTKKEEEKDCSQYTFLLCTLDIHIMYILWFIKYIDAFHKYPHTMLRDYTDSGDAG